MSAFTGERVLAWVWMGTVPYRAAWALQSRLAEDRRAGRLADDPVLLLEDPPLYTIGRTAEPRHVPAGSEALRAAGADYVDVDRGGSVTFHGPGQLVAYPIVALHELFPLRGDDSRGDVLLYLRALEDAL